MDVNDWLTSVHVALEGEGTLLYVEGEGVDIEVAGTLHFDRLSIRHIACIVHSYVVCVRGFVFVHTEHKLHHHLINLSNLKSKSIF